MWELFTYGKRPYENIPAREVHTLLERGKMHCDVTLIVEMLMSLKQ